MDKATVRLTVEGPLASDGRLALSELARLAAELQGEMERIALVLSGEPSGSPGRRPKDIVNAVRLDLVSMTAGSVTLELAPHERQQTLIDSLAEVSIEHFLNGVERLQDDPGAMPSGFDEGVVSGLANFVAGLGRGISSIQIEGQGRRIRLTPEFKHRLRPRRILSEERSVVVSGRLHMGDFAPSMQKCRIDTPVEGVVGEFDDDLRDEVLDLMGRLVRAEGWAEISEGGRIVGVLRLAAIEPSAELRSPSLQELVDDQGAYPIRSLQELKGGDAIDDFDDFLDAIHSLRAGA